VVHCNFRLTDAASVEDRRLLLKWRRPLNNSSNLLCISTVFFHSEALKAFSTVTKLRLRLSSIDLLLVNICRCASWRFIADLSRHCISRRSINLASHTHPCGSIRRLRAISTLRAAEMRTAKVALTPAFAALRLLENRYLVLEFDLVLTSELRCRLRRIRRILVSDCVLIIDLHKVLL
jgi:hypothetical protein